MLNTFKPIVEAVKCKASNSETILSFPMYVFVVESILSSPVASSLSTLPFQMLSSLFQDDTLTSLESVAVQRAAMEVGAIQMVLLCLAVLSHHKPRASNHSHNLALQALSALTGR